MKKINKFILLLSLIIYALPIQARVYTGLEVFVYKYLNSVKGKRIGLITNRTGRDARGKSTIDILYASPKVNLVALFAPEHGIRGDVKAGDFVKGGVDKKTGLPIYSLYGGIDHKPTKEDLNKIDILIYDIQDVGARPYTYIWHMAECMKAIAENGKTMIILDRPSPAGAKVIDGPINEQKYISFIGLYQIPYVYGMTVGELAHYLNVEEKIKAKLYVVPMLNYRRGMAWNQTGLPWIAPSPNIPTPASAYCFATTGALGELGLVGLGGGTNYAFQIITGNWLKPKYSAAALNNYKLPGVKFIPIKFKYKSGYLSKYGINAVWIKVTNPSTYRPVTTEIAILCHLRNIYPREFLKIFKNKERINAFNKAIGNDTILKLIRKGVGYKSIVNTWKNDLIRFNAKRRKYLIYK